MYHQAASLQHIRHNNNESITQARIATRSSSDFAPNTRASIPTAAPIAVRWREMVASKPRSKSSSDVDAQLLTCRDNHSDQKDDRNITTNPLWLSSTYTTQTSVAVSAVRPRRLAATGGIHRRLCFSLDEKALFDLHNAQYYSTTTSQQQSSSDQSPQRTAMEPFQPPFAPPERVRTPDGVPSWPGVVETSAYTRQQQQRGHTQEARKKQRGGTWSRMKAKFRNRNRNSRENEGRGKRIRRALSFRQRRQEEPRTFTPWRPPMSGHSTFRFEA
jgi:hypothetical protein